jgi:hypothetical protein
LVRSDTAAVTDVPPPASSQGGPGPPPFPIPSSPDDPLAEELASYQALLDAWLHALEDGAPAQRALETLARYVDEARPRQLRRLLSPGDWFEPWLALPLPEASLLASVPLLPAWMEGGIALWRALAVARQYLDDFVLPYRQLGSRTLARIIQLSDTADSAPAVYAAWRRCQQAEEAEIVRSPAWPIALARVASANAELRQSHQELLSAWLGVDDNTDRYRALSSELASLRRRLRPRDFPT